MDMPSVGHERFARITKVIIIAAILFFVVALLLGIANRRASVLTSKNGMMGTNLSGNLETQPGIGMMGSGVSVPAPMMDNFDNSGGTVSVSSRGVVAEGVPAQSVDTSVVDKKIVKTGNLALKVESVEKTMDNLRWVAGQFGGDIFSSSIYDTVGNNSKKSGLVTIKVPAAHFDEAMQSIKSAASVVVRETTNGQDVTSQYVDLQARLKNKQAEEESIAAILTRDTTKITDVLQVTTELARVRGEIEQLQAQVKYLDNQSDMSTITISFTEDAQIGSTDSVWRPSQEIKDAFNALIKAGQRVVSFLISFVIVFVPILIVLLVIFGGILYVIVKKLYKILNR
jgi:hypothetical protein